MIKKVRGKNALLYTASFIFLMFVILAYFFPYSGDDWAWGSSIGINRLKSLFRNYNGRYAGNLFVLLLTRIKWLQILFVAGSMLFLSIAAKIFNRSAGIFTLLFSAMLFLLLPKQIFVQALVWTSGYTNYVPPILLNVLYMLLVRNIFDEKTPKYHRLLPLAAFLIAFVGALFMENLTLYSLAMSFFVIAFCWIRFHQIYKVHVFHFAGVFFGAIVMFTNGAYLNIANNTDTYRSTALTKGILTTVKSHCEVITEQFFIYNLPMLLVISILCIVLTILYMKNCKENQKVYVSWAAIFINILCLGILYSKDEFAYWVLAVGNKKSADYTLMFMVLIAFVYCVAVLMTVLFCVKDRMMMWKLVFWLVSIVILLAPLLVVNPIGPRNFFPPYVLLVMFCGTMLHYIQVEYGMSKSTELGISISAAAIGLAMFFFMVSIYGTIHSYDVKRAEYVRKQVELGCEEITVCKLPYTSYVWFGDPTTEPWGERFKLFYGIDKETKLNFLSYSEFNKWTKEFDKQ